MITLVIEIIANLFVNVFNFDFETAKKWSKRALIVIGVFIFLIVALFVFRTCGKATPVIDQEAINKINAANEAERKKELQTVIEDNANVVRTVDDRTTIADTNAIERNRLIDEKIKQADKAISDAKSKNRDVTAAELECILTGKC